MHHFSQGEHRAEDVRDAVLQWLAAHGQWLVVVDNADDVAVFAPYIPQGAGGRVLITSRLSAQALVAAGCVPLDAQVVHMDMLGHDDALQVLGSVRWNTPLSLPEVVERLGGEGSDEHRAALWLVGHDGVDGLPLALAQAGAYMRQRDMDMCSYVGRFKAVSVQLFGGEERVHLTPRALLHTWLQDVGLGAEAQALASAGVDSLHTLWQRCSPSPDLSPGSLTGTRLAAAMIDKPPLGPVATDQLRKLWEVRRFLSLHLRVDDSAVDVLTQQCGVRRLNDLRGGTGSTSTRVFVVSFPLVG
jgi:hypothetical protein